MTVTATIIPVSDNAGNMRHVYLRGEATARTTRHLDRFMKARGLGCDGDWHGFQQPTFADSIAMARAYGVTGDDARCIDRYDGASDAEPMADGWKIRPYYGQE